MREEKVKDYTFSDVSRHLEVVLDLVPWKEMAQSDFVREDVNIDRPIKWGSKWSGTFTSI